MLDALGNVHGQLFSFAVNTRLGSLFQASPATTADPNLDEAFHRFAPRTREHLHRVLFFSACLIAGLVPEGADALWITDDDEIAANNQATTDTSILMENYANHLLDRKLGKLRFGPASIVNPRDLIEDILSLPDLAAGAVAESLANSMHGHSLNVPTGLIVPLDRNTKPKAVESLLILNRALVQKHITISLQPDAESIRFQYLAFHEMPFS